MSVKTYNNIKLEKTGLTFKDTTDRDYIASEIDGFIEDIYIIEEFSCITQIL